MNVYVYNSYDTIGIILKEDSHKQQCCSLVLPVFHNNYVVINAWHVVYNKNILTFSLQNPLFSSHNWYENYATPI